MDKKQLANELRRDEGERLKAYKCTAGKTTIGVGRNLDDRGISEKESAFLLRNDIDEIAGETFDAIPWLIHETDARQRALVNMAFNMGVRGLLNFQNMLFAMQDKDYYRAANESLNSRWAEQVGARSERIAGMIREG